MPKAITTTGFPDHAGSPRACRHRWMGDFALMRFADAWSDLSPEQRWLAQRIILWRHSGTRPQADPGDVRQVREVLAKKIPLEDLDQGPLTRALQSFDRWLEDETSEAVA